MTLWNINERDPNLQTLDLSVTMETALSCINGGNQWKMIFFFLVTHSGGDLVWFLCWYFTLILFIYWWTENQNPQYNLFFLHPRVLQPWFISRPWLMGACPGWGGGVFCTSCLPVHPVKHLEGPLIPADVTEHQGGSGMNNWGAAGR